MAIDLTNLRKEVQDLKDETDSAVALITGLADQISSIPQSKDKATQAALDDLVQQLNDNALPLANAIKANTVTLPNPPGPVGNANPTPPVVPASDNPNPNPNPNPADTGRTNI